MEKKIIIEELTKMKYLSNYKRGVVISEQNIMESGPFQDLGSPEACINFESGEGLKRVENVNQQIQSLGVNDELSKGQNLNIPSQLEDIKNQLDAKLSEVLPNASLEDIKGLISYIKKKKNNPEEKEPIKEQAELIAIIQPILAAIPVWGWAILGTWIILRLLRCFIYKAESKLFHCAFNWKKSPLAYITFLLLLDFKNMKRGNTIYGCK
jgi:hypothetical protein